jgi:transcriptional regulator with XRE-family HTH domain
MKQLRELTEPKDFAGRLSWLRARTGLTQNEFGKRCGVTKGYVSRLESGQRENPSGVFLRRCCETFRIPWEWLEKGAGPLPMVDQATRLAFEAASRQPGRAWSARAQQDLIGFMQVLLESVPMTRDTVLKLTARVWESPELSDEFKRMLVLGANLAFGEREQKKQSEPD